ncbi:MAG TPA: membrane dipeptidase [Dokdonella sp.]
MPNRRDFLLVAGATALARALPAQPPAASASSGWPPYRNTLSIDGESGIKLLLEDVDSATAAKELAAVRASGLGATLLQVAPAGPSGLSDAGFEETQRRIAHCRSAIAAHEEAFLLVGTTADLARAQREQRLGVILRFQDSTPLGFDLDRVALFRDLGVRVIQLTHNGRNLVGDGLMEPGNAGLSNFGHAVVEQLNAQKVVVDLAHGSQRTIAEGIAASKAPVLISHAGCRALADLPRNVGDAELRAMARRGGAIGIIFWPYLRTEGQPTAIDLIAHLEHAIKVCGEDHVGLGTDGSLAPVERTPEFEKENREIIRETVAGGFFGNGRSAEGLYMFIAELNVADRFDRLAAMLSERGHADARIAKILGGNFARVMGDVWG